MSDNGSTGSASPVILKRTTAAKNWCFTLNNYTDDELKALCLLGKTGSNKFIIGKEIGKECGTPHLQGYISFGKKCRPLEIKDLTKRIHWEKCKGSQKQNIEYCSKDGSYETNLKVNKPLKILEESKLYKWQIEIRDMIIKEPDDRTIVWIWEPKGKMGKTTFAKYLAHHHGGVPIEGKKNDILFCAANFESDLYIFDFERDMEEYISYGAMEKIKNGFYMCAKYESKPIVRNPPHVICFANFAPDEKRLSKDRWKIIKL